MCSWQLILDVVTMFVMSVVVIEVWGTQLPIWALFFALVLGAPFDMP